MLQTIPVSNLSVISLNAFGPMKFLDTSSFVKINGQIIKKLMIRSRMVLSICKSD
jgi:hypothetical protein